MSALPALRSTTDGKRPRGELLPTCRLEALGSAFYGEEAIVQSFRRAPADLPEDATVVESPGHLALFAGETAIVADVSGDAIARIWRLGPGQPAESEPSVGVPFDTDLMQARADLAMRAADHPSLSPKAVPGVERIGRSIARDWSAVEGPAAYRTRSFLVRAFDDGVSAVALFAVHKLGSAAVRSTGFYYVAALFQVEGEEAADYCLVSDLAGEAAVDGAKWRPRVE